MTEQTEQTTEIRIHITWHGGSGTTIDTTINENITKLVNLLNEPDAVVTIYSNPTHIIHTKEINHITITNLTDPT